MCDDATTREANGRTPVTDEDETTQESRQERLRRNTSSDPESKTHEDESNPMHADSWSGGSINPEAKKIARGEAPRDSGPGPNTPSPAAPATPSSVSRPWSPEPTQSDTTGSTEGVDYAGKPRGEDAEEKGEKGEKGEKVEARQAPPTTSPQKGAPEGGRPEITKRG